MLEPGPVPKMMIADKGYDSDAICKDHIARKADPVISHAPEPQGTRPHRRRHVRT